MPACAGDIIPKPLVGQLMRCEREGEEALRGHGLMLHPPAKWGHHMAVFFLMEGVGAEEFRKLSQEGRRGVNLCLKLRQRAGVVINVVLDEHGLRKARDRGIKAVIYVLCYGKGHEIIGDGVSGFPAVAEAAVG